MMRLTRVQDRSMFVAVASNLGGGFHVTPSCATNHEAIAVKGGVMRRLILRTGVPALCLLAICATASGQSAISGTVRDSTGAVLPGVTVEAASPALIEKARSVVTDSGGQYKIVDLRPGTYRLAFTLEGFNTVRREGIELPASFTATINAEMRVGTVSETLTVTGEAPIVEVQSPIQQSVISRAVLFDVDRCRSL